MNDHESNERPEEPHETPQEIEDNTVHAPPTGNAPIDEGRKPAVPTPPAGSIFPVPPAISAALEFTWDENKPTVEMYVALGTILAQAGDLYRSPNYGGGLTLGSQDARVPPLPITEPKQLAAMLLDRVRVKHEKDGKTRGIPDIRH